MHRIQLIVYGKSRKIQLIFYRKGTDNLENEVAFTQHYFPENEKGQLVYDFDESKGTHPINEDAKSFKLQAIAYRYVENADGTYNDIEEKIGEPFSVEIGRK